MGKVANAPIVGVEPYSPVVPSAMPDTVGPITRATNVAEDTEYIKTLKAEIAAASKLGAGLTPDQIDAQTKAEVDYLGAVGATNRAKAEGTAATKALTAANTAESAASKAAADAEAAAAAARTQATQDATSAVQGLQSALNDLSSTPLLGTGAFDAEQAKLQDRLNEIDLAQKQLSGSRGNQTELRALAKERIPLEKQLAVSQAQELVRLGPEQRTLSQALNPPLPEASLQDILTRAAAARGGLLAAQNYQQSISQTNNVTVNVDSGGNVAISGGDAALGQAIADGVKTALAGLVAVAPSTGARANPALPGGR
jgi:hypothetical protein